MTEDVDLNPRSFCRQLPMSQIAVSRSFLTTWWGVRACAGACGRRNRRRADEALRSFNSEKVGIQHNDSSAWGVAVLLLVTKWSSATGPSPHCPRGVDVDRGLHALRLLAL